MSTAILSRWVKAAWPDGTPLTCPACERPTDVLAVTVCGTEVIRSERCQTCGWRDDRPMGTQHMEIET